MQPVPELKVRVSPRFILQTTGQYVYSKGRMHLNNIERSQESTAKKGKGVFQKNFENLNITTPTAHNDSIKHYTLNAGTSADIPM